MSSALARLTPHIFLVLFFGGLVTAQALAATVVVNNINAPGEGFNDSTPATPVAGNPATTIGSQRLAAFQAAADEWAATLVSPVTIVIDAQMTSLSCSENSAVLGSAGPRGFVYRDFPEAPSPFTWYPQALVNALRGFDVDDDSDVAANFNQDIGTPGCLTSLGWSYVIGAPAPPGTIPFTDTVIHEIGHGLGFLTYVDKSSGELLFGFNDHYSQFLLDETPSPTPWGELNDAQRAASATDDGNLTWTGPEVANVAGLLTDGRHPISSRVRMYAPVQLAGGSSVSHFDTALFPHEIMEPSLRIPNEKRLTNHLMLDIGWTGQAAVEVTIDDNLDNVPAGSATVYTMTFNNTGPADLSIVDAMVTNILPVSLINAIWTCSGSAGANCASPAGAGDVQTLVTLPLGSSISIELTAAIDADAAGLISNEVVLTMPPNINNTLASSAVDETTVDAIAGAAIVVSGISGDVSEAGGTATFSVVLNSQPADNVNVPLTSNDAGEGVPGVPEIAFTPVDWDSPQFVIVTGQDDAVADGDIPFTIELGPASSNDGSYNGLDPADVIVVNLDDDMVGITVSPISGDTTEDGGTATFNVVLDSQPTANVSLGLFSSNVAEGIVFPLVMTFEPGDWNVPRPVVVTGVADGIVDADIQFAIEFVPATSGDPLYAGLQPPEIAVTNLNTDLPPLYFKDGFEGD